MSSDHPAREVVQRYIDCSGALDADGLTGCFAPTASLRGYLGPTLIDGAADIYIKDVRRMAGAGKDMSGYQASIVAFEATGNVASAIVNMAGFAGAGFTDYLHLMAGADGWRIVSKTFTTV